MTIVTLLLIGLSAGVLSGLVGVGGGVIIVPALVILLHFSQKMAQGTALAMLLPPIGILAVLSYMKGGYVDFRVAAWLVIGFMVGGFFGARLVTHLPPIAVSRVFGVCMLAVAIRFLFFAK